MLYSTPIEGGYVYLEGSPPAPRQIREGAIELAAPLLPLDSRAVGSGVDAQGMIAFPQSPHQLQQIHSQQPPRPQVWSQKEKDQKGEESLAGAIAKGAIVSLVIRALL